MESSRTEAKSVLHLREFQCINNTGLEGTCLKLNDISALVEKSFFLGNSAARKGGAVCIFGEKSEFRIKKSSFIDNFAPEGSQAFMEIGRLQFSDN